MQNKFGAGAEVVLRAPYTCKSGDGALVGALFGVTCGDVAEGDCGVFQLTGAFDLPKAALEIGQGAVVYWDNGAKVVTTEADGNTKIGACLTQVAADEAAARVRLNGVV